ncbi:acyl-CoA dehydrogenase [Halieaceae bacterium IMCC14734]|uniref:Acyl-CoA dehydrogenase n=1 Tax=Candidatus Litorirhabdus singularis TaxID=2518993 RepID=A0ABT3TMN5_9GAMM|nr:acyl-CoA dehydrogenase [Candidatus Litorirhabdus singularis]MCX2983015.1 acyl-CoA dehydrogenase [Candidatus Litorirhabdus singularis]
MALVLNEEQLMLKDAAAGFLQEKASVAALRALRDSRDEAGYSKELWQEMADMGWAGIAIPEAYGGLDYGYIGLGIVLEQMGRNLSVSPLQSSVLVAATAIALGGSEAQKQALLPAIASGETIVTLALQEGPHHAPHKTAATAIADGDGYVISGRKVMVADAHVADKLIVVARTAGEPGDAEGLGLFLVDREATGVSTERVIMVDSRNSGTVTLDSVQVSADQVLGSLDTGSALLQQVLDIANIGLSAELLGLCLESFERTMEYLKDRKQFGAAIGTFQGLQHRAAEMYADLELAKSVVIRSLQAIDAGDDNLSLLASACKAKVSQVAARVSNEAIQMHGGIGMTDEFDIGFFIKRARVAQQTFGDHSYHLDRYATLSAF